MWSESDGERDHDSMGRSSTGSEVVMMSERALAGCSRSALPNVSNLNVTKSSRVHIGPKFVSVTQNVHNDEVVKGRFLGLEFVSAKNNRNLRCGIAVFVCWALVVVAGLAFFIAYFAMPMPTRLDLDIDEPWYLRRGDWQALNSYAETFLQLPVSYVLIGHSVYHYCIERYDCIRMMLEIQLEHLQRTWDDIGPNFFVGGNGLVFEGRGANVVGAMVQWWNSKSISIMFLGDYRTNSTTQEQFDHVNVLLKSLVIAGALHPNYTLLGHCQVASLIISPGPNVMNKLNNFAHWNPANSSLCLKS